jgi:hypothetical protein
MFKLNKLIGAVLCVALLTLAVAIAHTIEYNSSSSILVVQSIFGRMFVYTTPGYKPLWWGRATHYGKSNQFWFSSKSDQGDTVDRSIKVRFNDGGHAQISGGIRYDLPLDESSVLDLHATFGSQDALEKELIRPVIEKSVYMTGPIMNSKESYAEKRTDLISFIEDQAINGVYQTDTVSKEVEDPITKDKKWVSALVFKRDPKTNEILRQEKSPLIRFNVKLYNLSINDIAYEDIVVKQIQEQQRAAMDVQLAIAKSKKAEQDAQTAEMEGKANAAQAKWEQEKIKAKAMVAAQQEKEVAELNAARDKDVAETAAERDRLVAEKAKQAAEYTKQQQILLGEGEAERKKLVLAANGALNEKLDAYIKVNQTYADALRHMTVPIVPSVIMGKQDGAGATSANDLIEMFKVKTAKELGVEFSNASSNYGGGGNGGVGGRP